MEKACFYRMWVASSEKPSTWVSGEMMYDLVLSVDDVLFVERMDMKEQIDILLEGIKRGLHAWTLVEEESVVMHYLDGQYHIGVYPSDEISVRRALQAHYVKHPDELETDSMFASEFVSNKEEL
ncbi:hypothetical protein QO179_24980 [Bacillus stercoris]|nr:hypothetical protein [Bacillus stercoris]